jgi:ribonuclease HII
MLLPYYSDFIEAGCDEAGRGPLAGPVFAAAVVLPRDFHNDLLNDSKQLSEKVRYDLRPIIERQAIDWAVVSVSAEEIDEINILNASITGMHRALDKLKMPPEFIIIDGNKFINYKNIPHKCFVKGDGRFASIAAASVLAKTYRDDFMREAALKYPHYGWDHNFGYPTAEHRKAIALYGPTPLHRKTYKLLPDPQLF